MSKRALILGITGQDGSYLAELLLEKGYDVHVLYRRTSLPNTGRVSHLLDRLTLHQGDLCDPQSVERALLRCLPDEVYNLADQDHVGWSFSMPAYSIDITAGAVGRLLESCLRLTRFPVNRSVRIFQAISATIFGNAPPPQSESSPIDPMSPYACAKAHAFHLCRFYRRHYGLGVATGIFFNHDSPRRGPDYLLHKICRGAAEVRRAIEDGREPRVVLLHSPDDEVDIGFAGDYVEAAWLSLQSEKLSDYVIGTGIGTKVRDLVGYAGRYFNLPGDVRSWANFDEYRPPLPASTLRADASKARDQLGWEPRTDLATLVCKICARYAAELRLTRDTAVG